jgi:Mg/Co/Ni transporter MgtE
MKQMMTKQKNLHSAALIDDQKLTQLLSELAPTTRVMVLRLITHEQAIAVFEDLKFEQQTKSIHKMENLDMMATIEALEPDLRIQLLAELPPEISKHLIARLDPEIRSTLNLLLIHPERFTGRLMSLRYLAVRHQITTPQKSTPENGQFNQHFQHFSRCLSLLSNLHTHNKMASQETHQELIYLWEQFQSGCEFFAENCVD